MTIMAYMHVLVCVCVCVVQNDKPFVQRLFEPLGENGRRRTFGDLLRHIYGDGYKNCIIFAIESSLLYLI